MAIFILWTFAEETSAQEPAEEGAISYFTYFGNDRSPASYESSHARTFDQSEIVLSSADTANTLSMLPASGIIVPATYTITEDQLPLVVIETLKKRYYNRGFKIQDLRLIRITDQERCYSINLKNEKFALRVMLDEDGKVFKAELQ